MHREQNAVKIRRYSSLSQAKQTHGLEDRQRRRVLGVPWPLSKVVMGPTWAFCSPEAVGVIICQGARVGVCGRASVFLCSCLCRAHGIVDVSEHTVLRPDAVAPNRMKCRFTYTSLRLCDLYVPPNMQTYTLSYVSITSEDISLTYIHFLKTSPNHNHHLPNFNLNPTLNRNLPLTLKSSP